jgi:hypothetical protein
VTLRWRAFAPLSPVDPEPGFLPLLLCELQLVFAPGAPPRARNATLTYRFLCGTDAGARDACGGTARLGCSPLLQLYNFEDKGGRRLTLRPA